VLNSIIPVPKRNFDFLSSNLRKQNGRQIAVFTPPPIGIGGRGIVFARFLCLFVCLFVSFFVSLSATLRENGCTDLREIFREGAE